MLAISSIYLFDFDENLYQGDIFKNIPYLSFDILISSDYKTSRLLDDERVQLIDEITETGEELIVKTILSTTLCILASQDCDIEQTDLHRISIE